MAHNYTGLVKAVNTTNRDREAAAANQRQSDTPDDEFTHMIAEAAATMPAGFIEGPVEPTMLSIGELRGQSYWSAQAGYLHKVGDINPVFGQSVFAGVVLSAGDMSDRIDFRREEIIYSGALVLRAITPLGPVGLSFAATSTDDWQVVFGLGRPIEERAITDPVW